MIKNIFPETKKHYREITIDIVGNVDSGKSTLCGILSHPLLRENIDNLPKILDDGNGLSRARVLTLQHEKESGRTSTITYNYMILDNAKPKPSIVSLVDLAGHEKYLKTTITGIITSYSKHGFVLISKNITHMTKEHFSILATIGVPILFILTKCDIIPKHLINENINSIKKLSKQYKKNIIEITNINDLEYVNKKDTFCFIKISSKTGFGIPLLINYINNIKNTNKINLIKGFAIDKIYKNIPGFGLVISGITGIKIKKGDCMILGPFKNNEFINAKIRTLHNDYQQNVEELNEKQRGCLCLKIDEKYKNFIRMGMALSYKISDIKSVKKFEAHVMIFRGKSSNIKVGYNSYINIGMVKCAIKFTKICDPETGNIIKTLNSDKPSLVEIEFLTNYNIINDNEKFLFRAGRTQGVGKVVNLFTKIV